MRHLLGVLAFVTALLPCTARADSILINGSFESGPPMSGFQDIDVLAGSTAIVGWTVFGTSIDYLGAPWDVSNGLHAIDLDGRNATFSGVSQTFATNPGQPYEVSFDLSGNPQGGPTIKQVLALAGSASNPYSFDTTGQSTSALLWTSISFTFTATDAFSTLSFLSLTGTPNSYGALIDNVAVQRVPEPGTLVLVGTGLVAVVHRRRAQSRVAEEPESGRGQNQ